MVEFTLVDNNVYSYVEWPVDYEVDNADHNNTFILFKLPTPPPNDE